MSRSDEETIRSINQELSSFLDSTSERLEGLDEAGPSLLKEVRRLVDAGGSRIRPLLCVTAYQGCGGPPTTSISRVAVSFEILHTFALIHDDLVDAAEFRRGVPTTVAQHSISTAVLAGDLAFSLSDELYLASGFEPAALIRAFHHLAEARLRALTGQYLEMTSIPSVDRELPHKIARLKTSSYSLVGPLLVGAELAGSSESTLRNLEEFGENLGVAYQLRDDLKLLDGAADKDVAADLRNGRPTALISAVLRSARTDQRQILDRIWGDPQATDADVETVIGIARQIGAESSISQEVESFVSAAKDALQKFLPGEMSSQAIVMLNGLCDRLSQRSQDDGPTKGADG